MGRPAGRRRQQTRDAVLRAAIRGFSEVGQHGCTLADIAREAGVTPAAVCHHFGDKAGIYAAATDEIYRRLLALPVLDPDLSLEGAIAVAYAHAVREREGVRLLQRDILERGGLDEAVRRRHVLPLVEMASRTLGRRFGVSRSRARAAVVALSHLVARFVTNAPEDNRLALGAKTDAAAGRRIVALLAEVAGALLAPPRPGVDTSLLGEARA
jgi:AcrR family transcriptional regulator